MGTGHRNRSHPKLLMQDQRRRELQASLFREMLNILPAELQEQLHAQADAWVTLVKDQLADYNIDSDLIDAASVEWVYLQAAKAGIRRWKDLEETPPEKQPKQPADTKARSKTSARSKADKAAPVKMEEETERVVYGGKGYGRKSPIGTPPTDIQGAVAPPSKSSSKFFTEKK